MIQDKNNSEHYFWGVNCQGWRLLDTNDLSIIEEEMAPFTSEKYHSHKYAQQLFYILSGAAEFELGDQKYKVLEGQSFYIEPELKHRIINNFEYPLKFLVISRPSSKKDRQEII